MLTNIFIQKQSLKIWKIWLTIKKNVTALFLVTLGFSAQKRIFCPCHHLSYLPDLVPNSFKRFLEPYAPWQHWVNLKRCLKGSDGNCPKLKDAEDWRMWNWERMPVWEKTVYVCVCVNRVFTYIPWSNFILKLFVPIN